MLEKWQPVEIEWLDSVGPPGWTTEAEALSNARRKDELLHIAVGAVLEETEDYLLIIQMRHISRDGVGNYLQIPRPAIRKITILQSG